VVATSQIARLLESIDDARVDRLLVGVAERELSDAVEADESLRAQATRRWRARFAGLREWFLGRPESPSQAEILRARARSAIPALLAAATSLHDRRAARSDRTTDLRTLARWFAQSASEAEAHRLFRSAFAVAPCRHLAIDERSLVEREAQPVAPQTSWLDAPAMTISPRLRASGRYNRRVARQCHRPLGGQSQARRPGQGRGRSDRCCPAPARHRPPHATVGPRPVGPGGVRALSRSAR